MNGIREFVHFHTLRDQQLHNLQLSRVCGEVQRPPLSAKRTPAPSAASRDILRAMNVRKIATFPEIAAK
jgi:hypothetical protein